MRLLHLLLVAYGLLAVAIGDLTPHTTEDRKHQATVTVTMKQDKHRLHKRWEGPTPTGSEILIHPTGVSEIPKNGFDVRFGPELAKSLRTVLRVYCEHHSEAKCIDRLVEVLDRHGELKHKKRQLGAVQYLAAPLVGAAIYYFGSHKQPTGLHLPSKPVAQVSIYPSAKDVVFKTGAHDDHPMTYDGPPTKTASAHVSVKTEHSNKGSHHKGDVVIHVPEGAAHFLQRMLDHTNMCNAKHHPKRDFQFQVLPDAEIVNNVVKQILSRGDGAMPLDEMVLGSHQTVISLPMNHLNVSHPEDHVHSIMKWLEYNHIQQLMRLKEAMRKFVVQLIWVAAFETCIQDEGKLHQLVIPNPKLKHKHKHKGKCPKKAPKGKHAPLCVDCHGWDNGICKKGKWKECNCLFIAETTFYSDRKHLWNERETILEKALEPKHKEHETNCDTQKVDVENTSFKEAFQELCKDPLTAGGDGRKIVRDGMEFTLKHKWKKDKCPRPKWNHHDYKKECLESFRQFTEHTKCVYDSHVMAKAGHYHSECATSTFHIKKAKHHHHHRPREGPLHCHAPHGCYNTVNSANHVAYVVQGWCYRLRHGLIKGRHMEPGDKQVNFDLRAWMGTNIFARWIDGCKLEDSHDIAGENCEAEYYQAFTGCNNGGRGGWHRDGCVAMGMHPVCNS